MITEYKENSLYDIYIDTTKGNVSVGGEKYIINDPKASRMFKKAYILGRTHKKNQIAQALGL